ncbi:MAG: DNA-3-methyladenine glycosylase I, partial [Planctomycetes bacterium]|nr:DNA-3-methyladenine glycosylase I [Planctomycetota bacterium]
HDDEWGKPVHDDQRLFEKLCLEGFQAGLSWITILRKRDAFRRAFDDFEIERVARFGEKRVLKLLADASIVRHRGKIEATIGNAARALDLIREHGSLDAFFWSFTPASHARPVDGDEARSRTTSDAAKACAKTLAKRGFRFVGPTTMYAFLQSMGIVDDHIVGCHVK